LKAGGAVTRLSTILLRFLKPGKTLKITIIGAAGARNVGDLAIMKTIVSDLQENPVFEYSFASRDPFLRDTYRINMFNPFSLRGITKLLRNDVIVVGGGGLYGHETHRYLVMMLPMLRFLKSFLRKKLIFYNVGIYNAEEESVLRKLWPVIRSADEVYLRDDTDLDVLPPDVRSRATIEPDITYLLSPIQPHDSQLVQTVNKFDKIVGISLRYTTVKNLGTATDERIAASVKKVVVEQFLEKGIAVLFIPYQPMDLQYVQSYFGEVLAKYRDRFVIIDTDKLTVEEIKWLISKLHFALGMRLHFQIFARDLQIPVVGISYAPKCTNFLRKAAIPMVDAYGITAKELTETIHSLDIPQLQDQLHNTKRGRIRD
jgi:polysaccharide pyruvyl transferase WcaK-like protein